MSTKKGKQGNEPTIRPLEVVDSLRDKLILAVIVAVFSIIGSFIAILLTSKYEQSTWVRETVYNYQSTMLQHRIDIYDRAARIFALRKQVEIIQSSLELMPDRLLAEDPVCSSEIMRDAQDLRFRLDDLNAEFTSVANSATLYFGPDTRAAIQDLTVNHNPEWWTASDDLLFSVLQAMRDELTYGFEDMNSLVAESSFP
jgi:hypothetical protein